GVDYTVRLPLPGAFQVENALVAAGLAIATGTEPRAAFSALGKLRGAKGRLELVGESDGAPIFVDYAHKPDALAKALEALRPYAARRLTVVFGCGGEGEGGKRPRMGAIAARMADRVIVTDDNPRSENPAAIRAAILEHAPGAIEIGDRGEAIRCSVSELRRGDVLLIAGKGHETGQIVGKQVLPFSDHEAVAAPLAGGGAWPIGRSGPSTRWRRRWARRARARCRIRFPASPSTAARSHRAKRSAPSSIVATVTTSSKPRSRRAPASRSSPPTVASALPPMRRCSS